MLQRCLIAAAVLLAMPAFAQDRMPIIDTHVHYSQPAWGVHVPAAVFKAFDAAGVSCALVSSSPDEGTLTLQRTAPDRVVSILRPYREGVTSSNWFDDAGTPAYLEERLARGNYKGIGEFHLFSESSASTPVVRKVVEMAVARDIVVHVHSGVGPVRALLSMDPRLRVLWAHAGMSESPDTVADILDRHTRVMTEVSFRAGEIGGDGGIAPAGRSLFLRHTDRIMIGTDTYVTSRWDSYGRLVDEHRKWLNHLPKAAAEAIAWRNAQRLFGACAGKQLTN
ncbi:MAG: amidohydrolase [Alphaproteobacteria bacterium]|nr:amidohydrolase [Alphaproteobacteria bacterium]